MISYCWSATHVTWTEIGCIICVSAWSTCSMRMSWINGLFPAQSSLNSCIQRHIPKQHRIVAIVNSCRMLPCEESWIVKPRRVLKFCNPPVKHSQPACCNMLLKRVPKSSSKSCILFELKPPVLAQHQHSTNLQKVQAMVLVASENTWCNVNHQLRSNPTITISRARDEPKSKRSHLWSLYQEKLLPSNIIPASW